MAKVQPLTRELYRTTEKSGNSDFQNVTGVTDQRWTQLGWGPAKVVKIQCPFWLPGTPGVVAGNPFDLLISNALGQSFIELTPGNAAEFYVDRVEYLWVKRLPEATGLVHTAIDVHYWVNSDPVININTFMQYPTVQGGLRLAYDEEKAAFFDNMFRSFQQLYSDRARPIDRG